MNPSGKSQITRQKKIEMINSLSEASSMESKLENLSLPNEKCSDESNQKQDKIPTNEDSFNNDKFFLFSPNMHYESAQSSSSSSSSPLALQSNTNNEDKNKLAINNFDIPTSSPSSTSTSSNTSTNSNISSTSNSNSSASASLNILNNKHDSKEKLSKLKESKYTNNSLPSHPKPARRLGNIMKLSHQAGSFFSRSCPGEEMSQFNQHTNNTSNKSNEDENRKEVKNENNNIQYLSSNSMPKSPKPGRNRDETGNHRFLGKSFLALSIFARAGYSSKMKKNSESDSSTFTSPSTSASSSMMAVTDNEPSNKDLSVLLGSSACSNQDRGRLNKIGSYEVDIEKLARELVLPSLEAPLTSYKPVSTNTLKPPLLSSKTVDSPRMTSKKMILRSLTQNK